MSAEENMELKFTVIDSKEGVDDLLSNLAKE